MVAIRVGILTISDRASAGAYSDQSGPVLRRLVEGRLAAQVVLTSTIPDERAAISRTLAEWADSGRINLILTTGGTGFSPRDVTPEATRDVIDREAPGLAEAMRLASIQVTPHAMLSRAVSGIRGRTLIINLPGSPKGARENLQVVLPALPHGLELLDGGGTDDSHQYQLTQARA